MKTGAFYPYVHCTHDGHTLGIPHDFPVIGSISVSEGSIVFASLPGRGRGLEKPLFVFYFIIT